MSKKIRVSINYRGRVQGVGFRWNVKQLAKKFPCTGYVKNLADGSVEVLIEGAKKDLYQLVGMIDRTMLGKWVSKEMDERKESPHFTEFSIIH